MPMDAVGLVWWSLLNGVATQNQPAAGGV